MFAFTPTTAPNPARRARLAASAPQRQWKVHGGRTGLADYDVSDGRRQASAGATSLAGGSRLQRGDNEGHRCRGTDRIERSGTACAVRLATRPRRSGGRESFDFGANPGVSGQQGHGLSRGDRIRPPVRRCCSPRDFYALPNRHSYRWAWQTRYFQDDRHRIAGGNAGGDDAIHLVESRGARGQTCECDGSLHAADE